MKNDPVNGAVSYGTDDHGTAEPEKCHPKKIFVKPNSKKALLEIFTYERGLLEADSMTCFLVLLLGKSHSSCRKTHELFQCRLKWRIANKTRSLKVLEFCENCFRLMLVRNLS